MWTLTQTDDTLWYHVYTNQDKQKDGGDKKKRAGVPLQEEKRTANRFKDAQRKLEELPLVVNAEQKSDVDAEMLRDYFQLHVNLSDLYKNWGAADGHFTQIADVFTGQQIVDQACALLLHSSNVQF